MNLPNKLTIARIFLTFIFIILILQNGLYSKCVAALIFLLAAFTDFYDGYYAKKYNCVSKFGKLMDPIADKFLILTAFFIFMQMQLIAVWMFVIIFVREILITVIRLFSLVRGQILAAEKAGKIKTISQTGAICIILLYIILKESNTLSAYPENFWHNSIFAVMSIVVALTLFSGISYLWNNRETLHAQ